MIENRRWAAFEAPRKSQAVAYMWWRCCWASWGRTFYLGMMTSGLGMAALGCVTDGRAFLTAFVMGSALAGWLTQRATRP